MTTVVLAAHDLAHRRQHRLGASASASSRIVTSPWIMIPCSSGNRSLRRRARCSAGRAHVLDLLARGSRPRSAVVPREPQAASSDAPGRDTVEMRMFHSLDRISSRSSSDRARSRDRA
jgi:hypothetical protein